MAAVQPINDQSALVGDFIDAWGNDIISLFRFQAPIASMAGFELRELNGGKFHQPVDLYLEQGVTYAAPNTTPSGPGYLAASAGQMGDAQVEGYQLHGRSLVAYESIFRSVGDKQAVKKATSQVVKRLGQAMTKRLEIGLLHGQNGIGVVSANPSTGGSRTIVITDNSWSAGIWAGMANATIDLYNAGGVKQNAAAIVVNSISPSAKSITCTFTGADMTLNLSGLNIFLETSSPTTETPGLDKISRNTGLLYNINASSAGNELWAGNVYSTSTGLPSFNKLLDALSITASYGLMGMEAVAVVPPKAFEVLNSDQAALRRYDVSYRPAKAESGQESLLYHAQTGSLRVLPHPFQKDGMIHIFVPEETHRYGSSDVTFIDRKTGTDRLILESATSTSSEMRAFSQQALFVDLPRHTVVLDGCTY